MFSPVYGPVAGPVALIKWSKLGNDDIWAEIRGLLDVGYEELGNFQDLAHSGVHYSEADVAERRAPVLRWYAAWLSASRRSNFTNYLDETPSAALAQGAIVEPHEHGNVSHPRLHDIAARAHGLVPRTYRIHVLAVFGVCDR